VANVDAVDGFANAQRVFGRGRHSLQLRKRVDLLFRPVGNEHC
jgi:hypothetical protein